MLTSITLALALAGSAALSRAQVTPTGPSPGQSFITGQPCLIQWTPDTTGTWKTTYIELMTGDNFNMTHLTTVTSFDGTDPAKTSFSWTCPAVTIPAPIYFYQFTSTGTNSPQWTGRFFISANGTTVPAPNPTQPNGAAIPWGRGALANPAEAVAAPPTSPEFSGAASGSASATGSASSSASGSGSASASKSSSSATRSSTASVASTASASSAAGTASGAGTSSSAAAPATNTGSAVSLVDAAPLGAVLLGALSAALVM